MELKITQTEYDKIERLARCAISAYSKKDAKPYLTQLEFIANSGGYAGSVRNIISELYSSVSNAAGSVADKYLSIRSPACSSSMINSNDIFFTYS